VNQPPIILFRCDASSQIGFGHVVRCVALGEEFRRQGCKGFFAMKEGTTGFEMVKTHGFPVYVSPVIGNLDEYRDWVDETYDALRPDTLILDVRDDFPRSLLQILKEHGMLIATLDDPTDRRLDADLAFYPPIPQVQKMDWGGFTGQVFSGWEWVPLRKEFALYSIKNDSRCPCILVTMGGSDPAGLTLKAVAALDQLDEDFETVIVLGPGFSHFEALDSQLKKVSYSFSVRQNVTNMWDLMGQADIAIASFGATAYELAAKRVPGIYLGLTEDHVESASAFMNADIGVCLGQYQDVDEQRIRQEVKDFLQDKARCSEMKQRAGQTVDGLGAQRIAGKILSELKGRHDEKHAMASA